MVVAVECGDNDLTVQLEQGSSEPSCEGALIKVQFYRLEYEQRFGHQDLTGRPVRLRAAADLGHEVGGRTYLDAIDLADGSIVTIAHELNHVRTGLGHGGWCDDFEPWSEQVLGYNERPYLGCN